MGLVQLGASFYGTFFIEAVEAILADTFIHVLAFALVLEPIKGTIYETERGKPFRERS